MTIIPYTYQQCLSAYYIWIKTNIDQDQKDYYKECSHIVIWYDRIWGNGIKLIFFKDENDYDYILKHKLFAWRVEVHYWDYKLYHYPSNPTREWMIDFIVHAILNIYNNEYKSYQ